MDKSAENNINFATSKVKSTISVLLLTVAVDLSIVAIAVFLGDDPRQYLGEVGPVTWLSFAQLLIIANVNRKIFEFRKGDSDWKNWKASHSIWGIIAAGFLFLALDEIALIHENTDKLIHFVLGMEETGLTDRIDDLIVGLYGLVGIVILYYYRREFKRYPKLIPYLVVGFVFLFGQMIVDALHNRNDILPLLLNPDLLSMVKPWLEITEESFKLLGEAFFLAGFYYVLQVSRTISQRLM